MRSHVFFFFYVIIINNGIRLYTDKQTSPSHGTPSCSHVLHSVLQSRLALRLAVMSKYAHIRRKLTSHLSSCYSVGVEFIPLVAETLGGLVEDDATSSTKHLFGHVAIALQHGNASLWLRPCPLNWMVFVLLLLCFCCFILSFF